MSDHRNAPRVLGAHFPPAYDRPFLRYFDGDGAGAPGGTPTPTPPPASDPASIDPPAAPPAGGEPTDPPVKTPPWGSDDQFDPQRAWNLLQNKDADIAAERAKRDKAVKDAEAAAAQTAREEAYREFGKSLGIVKDDEAPTVEGLTAALQERDTKLTASDARNLALTVENAVLKYSEKHGGDADALSDSSSFTSKLKALDPAADDYATQVEALVKTTVESNSRYRKVQVAPKSSDGDPTPTGGTPSGEKSIDDIRKERQKRRGIEL